MLEAQLEEARRRSDEKRPPSCNRTRPNAAAADGAGRAGAQPAGGAGARLARSRRSPSAARLLLGNAVPPLDRAAHRLASDLKQLASLRTAIGERRGAAPLRADPLSQQQMRLSDLIARKSELQRQASDRHRGERGKTAARSPRRPANLQDLIERPKRERNAPAGARSRARRKRDAERRDSPLRGGCPCRTGSRRRQRQTAPSSRLPPPRPPRPIRRGRRSSAAFSRRGGNYSSRPAASWSSASASQRGRIAKASPMQRARRPSRGAL